MTHQERVAEWERAHPPDKDEPCQNCASNVPVESFDNTPPYTNRDGSPRPQREKRIWLCEFCASFFNKTSTESRNLAVGLNILRREICTNPTEEG